MTDYRQNYIKSRARVKLRKSVWTLEDQEETFSMEVNVEVFSRRCCPVVLTLGFILAQLGGLLKLPFCSPRIWDGEAGLSILAWPWLHRVLGQPWYPKMTTAITVYTVLCMYSLKVSLRMLTQIFDLLKLSTFILGSVSFVF